MKKYRLKKQVKAILCIILIYGIFTAMLLIASNRIEKIEKSGSYKESIKIINVNK